jgi:hypothetical protein
MGDAQAGDYMVVVVALLWGCMDALISDPALLYEC